MPVTLESQPATIAACKMEDGQLAVITDTTSPYHGRIVQMLRGKPHATIPTNVLICVGYPNGQSWGVSPTGPNFPVRVLQDGEIITVTRN